MKLDIIYEQQDFAIINKPAGLLVHPTPSSNQITLVDIIKTQWPQINKPKIGKWPQEERAGIVHRLDKDTSGLMIIAKNPTALQKLQATFKSHKVTKKYKLLCLGKLDQTGEIKTFTSKDNKQYNKQKISLLNFSWQKGKKRMAITRYKTIKYFQFNNQILTLAQAQILTGRTHQIRNHFKYLGYPIIGDQMYSIKKSLKISNELSIKRQFLHSYFLSFNYNSKKIKQEIELTDDLHTILTKLKK